MTVRAIVEEAAGGVRRMALNGVAGCLVALGCAGAGEAEDPGFVEAVPVTGNPLACMLIWTTSAPGAARIEWGPDDALEYVMTTDQAVTDHSVLLTGLFPERSHRFRVTTLDDRGLPLFVDETSYVTDPLSFDPERVFEVTVVDPERVEPGWTLALVSLDDVGADSAAVMLDEQGRVRWITDTSDLGGAAGIQTSLVDHGASVLIGGLLEEGRRPRQVGMAGDVIWEGPEQPAMGTPGCMHHTFTKLPNGDYLTLEYDYGDTLYDRVVQLDGDGQEVWSWPGDEIHPGEDTAAWGNMALMDLERGWAFYNERHGSSLYKIDVDTGDVLWRFGEGGDFTVTTPHDRPFPAGQHAPELHPDAAVLFYDNGWDTGYDSRVIEYRLDEATMEATILWEYPGTIAEDSWYTSAWGDADRLSNGNTLITAGTLDPDEGPSRIFEVTGGGDKVWELMIHPLEGFEGAGAYMADRVPPLARPL